MSQYSLAVAAENTINVSGDLTMFTLRKDWWQQDAKALLAKLDTKAEITFDLGHLNRSDSAGLAWLINVVRDAKRHSLKVVFNRVPDELLSLAKISDASALLPLK